MIDVYVSQNYQHVEMEYMMCEKNVETEQHLCAEYERCVIVVIVYKNHCVEME